MKDVKSYARKITTRLTQEDVDYINQFGADHQVSAFRTSTRMLIELSEQNLERLPVGGTIRLVKGEKVEYAFKLSLWVSNETARLIDRMAEFHDVPRQEVTRFLIRLAQYNMQILNDHTTYFIIR